MKKFSIFGLILGLTGLVSNYIFFFSVIFSIIFFMIQVLYGVTWRKDYYTILKSWIPKIIFFYIFLVIPFAYFNFNFIKTTFFEKKEDTSVNYYIERPIEDFFFFSSRPWYYVLPSVDNPFFGNVSRFVIESLQSRWGSFLTNNYFKSEHSASYLGYVNLIMAVLGIIYLRKNRFSENNNKLMFLGISALILILFSLNPYFDVFGVRIYLPSYLIVDYFSMFRVLSRIGILVLIVLLIFSGFGYLLLLDYLKKRTNNLLSYFVLTFFIMFSLVEFFVPLKFTDISKIPDVFEYLSKNTSKESKVLIMPDNKYNLSLFWSKDYNRDLIILNNLSVDGNFISSEDFNKKYFYSCAGLSQIKSKGTNYLIYFYNSDSNSIYKREFLNQNLEKIAEFNKVEQNDEIKTFFYRIIYTGNNFSNQAIIYKIPENLNCR